MRQGWSDAAGGLQRQRLALTLRGSYERGYLGGRAFSARAAAERRPAA
jgi:hypothetical protein